MQYKAILGDYINKSELWKKVILRRKKNIVKQE